MTRLDFKRKKSPSNKYIFHAGNKRNEKVARGLLMSEENICSMDGRIHWHEKG